MWFKLSPDMIIRSNMMKLLAVRLTMRQIQGGRCEIENFTSDLETKASFDGFSRLADLKALQQSSMLW